MRTRHLFRLQWVLCSMQQITQHQRQRSGRELPSSARSLQHMDQLIAMPHRAAAAAKAAAAEREAAGTAVAAREAPATVEAAREAAGTGKVEREVAAKEAARPAAVAEEAVAAHAQEATRYALRRP